MSRRLTKKSVVSAPGRAVKTPRGDGGEFVSSTRIPPMRTVISGTLSVRRLARSTSQCSASTPVPGREALRNPSAIGSRMAKASMSVWAWVASVRPGRNGTSTSWPAFLAACSTATQPPSTIRSASDTPFFPPILPPTWAPLNRVWIPSRVSSTCVSRGGSFTAHSFCGRRRIRAPLAPPRLSLPRKVDADAQAVDTSAGIESPEARIVALREAMSAASTSACVTGGSGSCQMSASAGTSGPR